MKESTKDNVGQLCTIVGLAGGLCIAAMIVQNIDNGWGAIICLFAGVGLGGWIGYTIGETIVDSSSKSDSPPINSTTTKNNCKESQPNTYLAFKNEIEKEFEKSIKEAMNDSMNKIGVDSPMMGMLVYSAIAHTCNGLKETNFRATGMNKQDADAIIDEITKKILHKYLENY